MDYGEERRPIGPMVPVAEVGDLRDGLQIETRVNGEVVQQGSTAQMIYGVGETLAHISKSFTIHRGDLLATGTPSGVVAIGRQPYPFVKAGYSMMQK